MIVSGEIRLLVSLEELNGCLPGEDVEQMIKMQENAVSVRLNRIRNSLKEHLCKEGYPYEA